MTDLVTRAQARWVAEGVATPSVLAGALDAFEAEYGVALPSIVRDYFEASDGTTPGGDAECFDFWPLAEVEPIAAYHGLGPGQVEHLDGWFLFADYLIHSHCFVVRLTPGPGGVGPVAFADGGPLVPLADSFEAFLIRYLDDRPNLRYYLPPKLGGPRARADGGGPG